MPSASAVPSAHTRTQSITDLNSRLEVQESSLNDLATVVSEVEQNILNVQGTFQNSTVIFQTCLQKSVPFPTLNPKATSSWIASSRLSQSLRRIFLHYLQFQNCFPVIPQVPMLLSWFPSWLSLPRSDLSLLLLSAVKKSPESTQETMSLA